MKDSMPPKSPKSLLFTARAGERIQLTHPTIVAVLRRSEDWRHVLPQSRRTEVMNNLLVFSVGTYVIFWSLEAFQDNYQNVYFVIFLLIAAAIACVLSFFNFIFGYFNSVSPRDCIMRSVSHRTPTTSTIGVRPAFYDAPRYYP